MAVLAAAAWGPATGAAALDPGEQGFEANCAVCHQKTGLGIPGAFPALAGDKLVQGDPGLVATTVLYGRAGMPPFKDTLDDKTLAEILTYVRGAWGNSAEPMKDSDFAAARKAPPPAAH